MDRKNINLIDTDLLSLFLKRDDFSGQGGSSSPNETLSDRDDMMRFDAGNSHY